MQTIRRCPGALRRICIVQQITIDIMLQDEPTRIKPIIEDLTPHDVSTYTPAVLVALVPQPVVTEDLGVKVVCLKGRVMNMALWTLEEEEGVVVDLLATAVEAEEDCFIFAASIVNELAGIKVEILRVEFIAFLEIGHAHAVMAKLMNRRRTFLEPLELVDVAVLLLRKIRLHLRELGI